MFSCFIGIVVMLGQTDLQTSAGINRMPGVVRVVDDPARSPFLWPCFAGLNEQGSELSRGEARYWCAVCCPANQPACQCVQLLSALAEPTELGTDCWPTIGVGPSQRECWPSLRFMISSLQSASLPSSLFPHMRAVDQNLPPAATCTPLNTSGPPRVHRRHRGL